MTLLIDLTLIYLTEKIKFFRYILFSYFPKFVSVECVGVVSYSLWEDSWDFVIYIKWQAAVDELLLTLVKARWNPIDWTEPEWSTAASSVWTSSTCLPVCENRGPETAGTGVSRCFVVIQAFTQGVCLWCRGGHIDFVLLTNNCV